MKKILKLFLLFGILSSVWYFGPHGKIHEKKISSQKFDEIKNSIENIDFEKHLEAIELDKLFK